jgi:hypothetical protein
MERVRVVTSKQDAASILMTVGPVFPFGPATATLLIGLDIFQVRFLKIMLLGRMEHESAL